MEESVGKKFVRTGMNYIEKNFPIHKLNPIALSEGNSKKPVYRMHKWWARRLGSVFRAVLLSVFGKENETEDSIWEKYCNGADLGGKIILDPFMGGGTTIVEALRLGCKVVGVDVNPVAWFVSKKETEPVDIEKLEIEFKKLEKSAGKKIKEYYRTTCPQGHASDTMYYFWVKTSKCSTCGKETKLFPNYFLSRRENENVYVCPKCMQIIITSDNDTIVSCHECGNKFDPHKGNSGRGLIQCSGCGEKQKTLDAVNMKGGPLDLKLHALEGYCDICGRFYKRADENDFQLLEKIRSQFSKQRKKLLFPTQKIVTEGRSDPRPVNHGYTHFHQMFNERQLLCLSTLLKEILSIKDRNIKELMLMSFSDSLNTNNMFCKYEVDWQKISLFFSLHAFHPIERPTENNVWGAKFGRGSFIRCYDKVLKGKIYGQQPFERLTDSSGRRYNRYVKQETIEGLPVKDFEELKRTEKGALLKCQSSEDLSFLPAKSVDAVVTDPPYFDNIQYAELADYFYVWLRLGLKKDYSWFEGDSSNSRNEIVKNDKLGKTTDFFNKGLCRVFTECRRVLKKNGVLVFTFHHNKVWAWEGMAELLLGAGFYVSATPIVRSEGRGEVHSSEGNIKYDCVFVCRKIADNKVENNWTSIKESIVKDSVYSVKQTLASGMTVSKVDVFTIVMSKTVEYFTKAVSYNMANKKQNNVIGLFQEMAYAVDEIYESEINEQKQPVSLYYNENKKQMPLFENGKKAG